MHSPGRSSISKLKKDSLLLVFRYRAVYGVARTWQMSSLARPYLKRELVVIFETKLVTLMSNVRENTYRNMNFDHFGSVMGARNWVLCFEVKSPQLFINAHLRTQI